MATNMVLETQITSRIEVKRGMSGRVHIHHFAGSQNSEAPRQISLSKEQAVKLAGLLVEYSADPFEAQKGQEVTAPGDGASTRHEGPAPGDPHA